MIVGLLQEAATHGDETLAEDWWQTVQNVGQVIVTLAIPLGAALLAVRKWGSGRAKEWVRGAVGVDGEGTVEELVTQNQLIATTAHDAVAEVSAKIDEMRAENTEQHRTVADGIANLSETNTNDHRRLHERINESQTELSDHIGRHDTKADGIETKVDRVERQLDRITDNMLRRPGE